MQCVFVQDARFPKPWQPVLTQSVGTAANAWASVS